VEHGECLGSYRSASADTGGSWGELNAWAEVDAERRMVVHLDSAPANCCPSPLAEFTAAGDSVQLEVASETSTESCDCMCVFDFVVTSDDPFAPGAYTLDVVYDGGALASLAVMVP
jgi:hypothetical protein